VDRSLTARGRERRRELMDYAAIRFADGGYHLTSVADIVEGLGVGKGVFYWYFSSKEELFVEILRDAQADLRRAQNAAVAGEHDPVERIELGIRSSLTWLHDHRHLFGMFQLAGTDRRFSPAVRRDQEMIFGQLRDLVKDGIAAGRIRDDEPDAIAHAVVGVLVQLARVYMRDESTPADDVADLAVRFCLEGLLVR
jgi:AcrR family transcriptional regulator